MKLDIGAAASRSMIIGDAEVRAFGKLVGDLNPVHFDDTYAKGTRFGRRIAHGMLAASLLSSVIANDCPGPGTVYLGQSLQFLKPVFIGDRVTAHVRVIALRADKPIATLETLVDNDRGEVVLRGEATVLVDFALADADRRPA